MTHRLFLFFLFTIIVSCGQKHNPDERIYDLLDFVIKDQDLKRDYGLRLDPDDYGDHFMNELIIKEPAYDSTADSIKMPSEGRYTLSLPLSNKGFSFECVTQAEMNYMLSQKNHHPNFKWNNSRLKFNLSNNKKWYTISLPLFSENGNKAVMTIRELCPGLCGYGWVICLTKESGAWTSKRGVSWIH